MSTIIPAAPWVVWTPAAACDAARVWVFCGAGPPCITFHQWAHDPESGQGGCAGLPRFHAPSRFAPRRIQADPRAGTPANGAKESACQCVALLEIAVDTGHERV